MFDLIYDESSFFVEKNGQLKNTIVFILTDKKWEMKENFVFFNKNALNFNGCIR